MKNSMKRSSLITKIATAFVVLLPLASFAQPAPSPCSSGAGADLAVLSFVKAKQTYCYNSGKGDWFYYSITVVNNGKRASSQCELQLKTAVDTRNWRIPALQPSERRVISSGIYVPRVKNPTLTAKIDWQNVVAESNEGNNSKSLTARNDCR